MANNRTLLDNRHPEYEVFKSDWRFWLQSYQGGAVFRNGGHLFKFPRETDANYKARKERADRINFTRQVLDLILQYLFKESITRKDESAGVALQTFWKDADRKGTGISDFMRRVAAPLGVFGCYYIVVDKPNEEVLTKKEQMERKIQPYAYGLSPLDVLDVELDNGRVTQILIREWTRGTVNLRESRESDALTEQYRLWYKNEGVVTWELYQRDKDKKAVRIDTGTISLPEIPIIKMTRGDSEYSGMSLVGDIATQDRTVYNYGSLLDQILFDQTFSTLMLPWDSNAEDFYKEWELQLGTKSIIPYHNDANNKPEYISPDASQGTLIAETIEKKIDQIYKVTNLQDLVGNAEKTGGEASGIAKGYDFEKLNAGLAELADVLEKAEEAIARLVNMWEGGPTEIPEDLIDYPEKFDTKSLVQELTEYNLLAMAELSETFIKHMKKRVVDKALPKLEEAERNAIHTEIDAQQDLDKEEEEDANELRE